MSNLSLCSFKLQMRQNSFSAGALLRTPLGELMTLPRPPSLLRRGTPLPIPFSLEAELCACQSVVRPQHKFFATTTYTGQEIFILSII